MNNPRRRIQAPTSSSASQATPNSSSTRIPLIKSNLHNNQQIFSSSSHSASSQHPLVGSVSNPSPTVISSSPTTTTSTYSSSQPSTGTVNNQSRGPRSLGSSSAFGFNHFNKKGQSVPESPSSSSPHAQSESNKATCNGKLSSSSALNNSPSTRGQSYSLEKPERNTILSKSSASSLANLRQSLQQKRKQFLSSTPSSSQRTPESVNCDIVVSSVAVYSSCSIDLSRARALHNVHHEPCFPVTR